MSSQNAQEKREESAETRENWMQGFAKTKGFAQTHRRRLDNLERAIIAQLKEDGRRPYQQIARELGVDEKTVRNRVNKLREAELLRMVPCTDGNYLKGCIAAMIAINISNDKRNSVEEIANDIAAMPMVSWVGSIMGSYDLMVEVVVENWEALTEFELYELPKIEGVGKTDSFLVLSHYGNRGVYLVDGIINPRE